MGSYTLRSVRLICLLVNILPFLSSHSIFHLHIKSFTCHLLWFLLFLIHTVWSFFPPRIIIYLCSAFSFIFIGWFLRFRSPHISFQHTPARLFFFVFLNLFTQTWFHIWYLLSCTPGLFFFKKMGRSWSMCLLPIYEYHHWMECLDDHE